MTISRTHRLAALAATAAALAVPATAAAHPSVYETTARSVPTPAPSPINAGDLLTQKRYVFANHGYAAVFRETNGVTSMGALNFAALPSAYRNQASKTANFKEAWYVEGGTGVQVHATCQGAPALSSFEAIGSWQGADPFYGYIPFQKTAAGFDDDAADWIGVVKTLTGVDLETVADPAAACAGIGGTYTPADAFHNPPPVDGSNPDLPWTSLSSHTIEHKVEDAVTPLEAEIDAKDDEIADLEAELAALKDAKAATDKALAESQALAKTLGDKAAAAEQASAAASAQAKGAATPLGLALAASPLSVKQLTDGLTVTLSGPAGERAHVRAVVSTSTRRKHRLPLRTVASATTTLGTGGVTVTLKPSASVAKALAKLTGSTTVTFDVSAGGRTVRTTATLTR